jgi:colanic acid/amylovoran biosynthesis glycosyltransferase
MLFEKAALILSEVEFGRNKLIKRGCRPEVVKVHHLGVDVGSIPFKIREKEHNDNLRLVQIANFTEKKGHAVLIESMRLLEKEGYGNQLHLTLIGNGPTRKKIMDLVAKYKLGKRVAFVNQLPYNELHSELLLHHVFVHPSITAPDGDCEGGAPVVLLDAQATGMPVISTFHCDIPEEIIHGQTGFLVNEMDAKMLAEAVKQFIINPKLISDFGVSARSHVEKNYSAVKQAAALTDLYDALLSLPSKASVANHILHVTA